MTLSSYQNLLVYYGRLQEAYGWTMWEIDAHEVSFLLEQFVALQLADTPTQQRFIDDIL